MADTLYAFYFIRLYMHGLMPHVFFAFAHACGI